MKPTNLIILLSPAKTMDFSPKTSGLEQTQPVFKDKAKAIAAVLKQLDSGSLKALFKCSDGIAAETLRRYREWAFPPRKGTGKEALLAYAGTVFEAMDAASFSLGQHTFSAAHLRILDALYGWLRPTDIVAPYRLEMQTRVRLQDGRSLADLWRSPLQDALRHETDDASLIVNLASGEYSKVLGLSKARGTVITPVFKDDTGKGLKVLGAYAKRARGLFCRYLVAHQLTDAAKMKAFGEEGYRFDGTLSNDSEYVYTRRH